VPWKWSSHPDTPPVARRWSAASVTGFTSPTGTGHRPRSTAVGPQDHRDNVTLVHVCRWQAGHVIHRSKVRPGNHTPNGRCRSRNWTTPTRVTDPHDEQPTAKIPCGGSGSVAVAVDVAATASPLGVASENSACLPAGRACDRAGVGWVEEPRDSPTNGSASTSDTSCWSMGIQYSARFPNGSGPSAISQQCRRRHWRRPAYGPTGGRPSPQASSERAGGSTCPGPAPRRTGSTCAPEAGARECRTGPPPLR
jgi:hypothetical protein